MIGVGINKDVIVTGAAFSEETPGKARLALTFDYAANVDPSAVDKPKASVFDQLQTAKVEDNGKKGTTINFFPFKVPTGPRNETKTEDEKIEMVSNDMLKLKNQLTQLLEVYLTTNDIKWEPYYNTGIDGNNYRAAFMDNDQLAKVFANYGHQFVKMITPFMNKPEFALRLKLVRQSKEKHYATIPGMFLSERPYVDLMLVTDEQTKVKFSDWEINNGLNDPKPVAQAQADNSHMPPTDGAPAAGASVFGQRQ